MPKTEQVFQQECWSATVDLQRAADLLNTAAEKAGRLKELEDLVFDLRAILCLGPEDPDAIIADRIEALVLDHQQYHAIAR